MAKKIKDDFELQVSYEAVERLRRALGHAQRIPQPEIRKDCSDSLQIWIDRIDREIEEYLARKAGATSAEKKSIKAASG
ncbi:TPA: hypothetical protein EYP66_24595 [Candidatus Poribacteria bacterium]|nr:hypothetical protein [Candidatus Poribacteria bacterium]